MGGKRPEGTGAMAIERASRPIALSGEQTGTFASAQAGGGQAEAGGGQRQPRGRELSAETRANKPALESKDDSEGEGEGTARGQRTGEDERDEDNNLEGKNFDRSPHRIDSLA
jgi:hypothetical protein